MGFKNVIVFCFVAVVVLVFEGGMVKLIFSQTISPQLALVTHLIVVAALLLWTYFGYRAGRDLRLSMLLSTAIAVLGPFGAAGFLVSIGLFGLYKRSAKPFEEWYETLFPEEDVNLTRELYRYLQSARSESDEHKRIVPFKDVLSFGTIQQKRSAIVMIAKNYRPVFAPALLKALKDSNNAIRVQAATAITYIENKFHTQAIEIEETAKRHPEDPEIIYTLARHYDDYAYAGLLDAEREQENRKKAIEAYLKYLQCKPYDLNAIIALGRILLRKGSVNKAADLFRRSIKAGNASPKILVWYMECMFRLGRFEEIRKITRIYSDKLTRVEKYPVDIVGAVKLWTRTNSGKKHSVEAKF